MPQVPVYGDYRVQEQGVQGGFQQAPRTDLGMQAIGKGVEQIAETGLKIQMQQDELRAEEAELQITNDWMQWDAENRQKYQGARAAEYSAAASEWWDKARENYGQNLSPYGKRYISRRLGVRRVAALGNASAWSIEETERHRDSVFQAGIDTTINSAVAQGTPDTGALLVEDQISAYAARKNLAPEQSAAMRTKALTQLHTAYISDIVQKDGEQATAYLEAAIERGEIDTAQIAPLREGVKREYDAQWARSFALEVQGLPYAEQVRRAEAIKDPDRQHAALVQVDAQKAREERVIADGERAARDEFYARLLRGERPPQSLLARMDPYSAVAAQTALERTERQLNTTDWTKFDAWMKAPDSEIAERSLGEILPFVAKDQQSMVETRWNDARKAVQKGPTGLMSNTDIVNQYVTLAGLDQGGLKPGSEDAEAQARDAALLRVEMQSRIVALEARLKREATPDEKRAELEPLALDRLHKQAKEYLGDGYADDSTLNVLMTPEERASAAVEVDGKMIPVASIPAEARAKAVEWLRRNGMPVTEQAIARLYLGYSGQQKPTAPPRDIR